MELSINKQTFLVCGATSGFGKGTARALMNEGARVLGVARNQEGLKQMKQEFGDAFISLSGDISQSEIIHEVVNQARKLSISGALINAGGPPALAFEETQLSDWDEAYQKLLRWKVELTQQLLPHFKTQKYGRLVYIESSSVKQPIENLVLSTSLRLAVVGMVKTVSQEVSGQNINLNIIAPGSHATPAIERLIKKKSELSGQSLEAARKEWIENIPAKQMGNPDYLGTLAAWLLSPMAAFVTGQVYALEGGAVKSTM
ncbi:MAG: short-chain dehydrogenase [Bacteroidetes bacterium HGW-Bacteroidetes-4]|jgi:3-oxoacyl-[acyl-carrier protein] reductase|nr:MAG: short-chain dehydrogenase [Bacteroidetes bacterium HGW-Bacteroidetes-4]